MPSIDFEVWCSKCGEGICNNYNIKGNRYGFHFQADPCEKCLDNARAEKDEDIKILQEKIDELEAKIVGAIV